MDGEIDLEDPTLGEFFLSHEDLLRLYEAEYGDTSTIRQCVYGTADSIYQQLYQLVLIVLVARAIKIICEFCDFIRVWKKSNFQPSKR